MPVNPVSNEYAGTAGDDVFVNRPRPEGNVTLVTKSMDSRTHVQFLSSGTQVVFQSYGQWWVKDLVTGAVALAAPGEEGSWEIPDDYASVFSPDGAQRAYIQMDGEVASDRIYIQHNVYVENVLTGETTLVSKSLSGGPGNGLSFKPTFSPDGSKIAYWSSADNLVADDPNGAMDIFIKDLITQDVTRIRVGEIGPYASDYVGLIAFSPDGTKIAFQATSDSLLGSDDQDRVIDVFVLDITKPVIGVDVFYGGEGVDTVSYRNAASGVTIYLPYTNYSEVTGDAKGDQYFSIERFQLSSHNDVFVGASIEGVHNWASGGAGDDVFEAGGAGTTNVFYGGSGGDVFVGSEGLTTAHGGEGDDWFATYSVGVDYFVAGGGNDLFQGEGGDDVAFGGSGLDRLEGMDGNDTLRGGGDDDLIYGGNGDDTLHGDGGIDTITGDDGDDFASGGLGDDSINGGLGNDTLHGGGGQDSIDGAAGEDRISGGEGDDILNGNEDNDVVIGGEGADTLNGNDGDDVLIGQGGDDQLYGEAGNDRILGGEGNDTIDDQDGDSVLIGGGGNDVISGFGILVGGDGDDQLYGNGGLYGGAGNDVLEAWDDIDSVLIGGEGADTVSGSLGNDSLRGGDDVDTLFGNLGNDGLHGGAGADTFLFGRHDPSHDVIHDFSLGEDAINFLQIAATDLSITIVGNSAVITIIPFGTTIRVRGVTDIAVLEQDFVFA